MLCIAQIAWLNIICNLSCFEKYYCRLYMIYLGINNLFTNYVHMQLHACCTFLWNELLKWCLRFFFVSMKIQANNSKSMGVIYIIEFFSEILSVVQYADIINDCLFLYLSIKIKIFSLFMFLFAQNALLTFTSQQYDVTF